MNRYPLNFLGVEVDALNIPQLNSLVAESIEQQQKSIIANHNLNSLHIYHHDPKMREFYAKADYIHIDGMPLVFIGKLLGYSLKREQRVTYADWVWPLMEEAASKGWRIFYLGSKPGVAEQGANILRQKFPGLEIACAHGYIDVNKDSQENQATIAAINAFQPHILMVGMSMPRQEHWILDNLEQLQTNVILPSGACIDYVAGAVPTPPRWMGKMGLEWAYRLYSEPRRLWKRYLIQPWFVGKLLIQEILGISHRTKLDVAISGFEPDLRSAKSATIQRGLFIRLLRVTLLILLDILSLSAAWDLAVNYSSVLQSEWTKNLPFLLLTLGVQVTILATIGLYRAGLYRRDYVNIIKAVSLSSILLLFITYIYEPSTYIARSTYLLYWFVSIACICTVRFIFDISTNFLRQKGVMRHSIFLITDAREKEQLMKIIEKDNSYTIQGFADSSCLDWANREETFTFLRNQNVEEVFISWDSIKNRSFLYWHFYNAGITLHILPTENKLPFSKSRFSLIGGLAFPTIAAPIFIGVDFWIKRLFDFCFSLFVIILLAPVYLSIAILIKLDSPGPIFFRQKRIGLHGREFMIWKFRTMISDAEKFQADLEHKNEMKDGVFFKMKDDPRVTKVGQFLRRYSLDELPQLFNILVGEMSLIGPRPLPIRDVENFKSKDFIRQEVLPGITGLWQVSGRSNIDNFDDVMKLDMNYIENWSILLDISIFLQTFRVILQKTGAY